MQQVARLILAAFSSLLLVQAPVPGSSTHMFGNPQIAQRAPSRTYHVENYKLTLHFDQSKGEVFGDESVTLRPLTARFARFYLNASELKIDSVALEPANGKPVALTFETGDPRLWVTLDRAYSPSQDLHVRIVYHGFPRTGLFFVNPNANYQQWPREIMSQGEPEFNRYWFPCWDFPNDMSTSETVTTVPEGQSVVSNGKLVKVTRNGR
jgi:aminopeptidase N